MNNNYDNNYSDMPDKDTSAPIVIGGGSPSGEPGGKREKHPSRKSAGRGIIALTVCICVLLSGLAGFGGVMLALNLNDTGEVMLNGDAEPGGVIYKAAPASTQSSSGTTPNAFAQVAANTKDTVVEIQTEQVVTNNFYGQYITSGAGSGVIITENGYIITCAHVIDGASKITVKTTDGTEYVATLVGSDAQTDIAVIKIDKTGLPFAVIGDSDKLVIGEDVIAIGNPLGSLGGSVTNGIISALDREIEIEGQSYNLLQTNAAINPGNSGGALFNMNSELVGIVNAKSSGSGIEGIGFSIPINDAINVADQLISYGYIKGRPALGIYVLDITSNTDLWELRSSEHAAIINYMTDFGVYFIQYNTDLQTEGGLQFGDRIVAINGISVSSKSALAKVLADECKIGDTVKLTVSRMTDTKTQRSEMVDVEITLVESAPAPAESADVPAGSTINP